MISSQLLQIIVAGIAGGGLLRAFSAIIQARKSNQKTDAEIESLFIANSSKLVKEMRSELDRRTGELEEMRLHFESDKKVWAEEKRFLQSQLSDNQAQIEILKDRLSRVEKKSDDSTLDITQAIKQNGHGKITR